MVSIRSFTVIPRVNGKGEKKKRKAGDEGQQGEGECALVVEG